MRSYQVQRMCQKSKNTCENNLLNVSRLDKDDLATIKGLKTKPYEEIQILSEVLVFITIFILNIYIENFPGELQTQERFANVGKRV